MYKNIEDDEDDELPISFDLVEDDDDFAEDDDDNLNLDDDYKPSKRKTTKRSIGKHSLIHDNIFKGKKDVLSEDDTSSYVMSGNFNIKEDTLEFEESRNNIDHYRDIQLKADIYRVLKENTDLDFLRNRRKPSKSDFNAYYAILVRELFHNGYSRISLFIELADYFSDNVWNMFQLLEKNWSNIIIKELQDKYGLSDVSKMDFIF